MAAVGGLASEVRRRLDVLEDSRQRIVLRERPHRALGTVFCLCGFSLLALIALRRPQPGELVLPAAILIAGLAMISFGVFCLVESTIAVSLETRDLSVRRSIGWLKKKKSYPVEQISRVVVRSAGKGSGLGIELASGRKRNLTFFTEYADPAEQAGKLNHYIRTAGKRRG